MNVNVVFQSRTAASTSSDYCAGDCIMLSPGDLRTLKCRVGAFVSVLLPESQSSLLCRAWPSKKGLGNGTATLNRAWWPNFPADQKGRSCVISRDTSGYFHAQCSRVTISVQLASIKGGEGREESEVADSGLFQSYVTGCFEGIPLSAGISLGLTWKGSSVVVCVLTCEPDPSCSCPAGRVVKCIVDTNTILNIVPASKIDTSLGWGVPPPTSSSIRVSAYAVAGFPEFAGYEDQAEDAWAVVCLGLNIGEPGRRLSALAAKAPTPLLLPTPQSLQLPLPPLQVSESSLTDHPHPHPQPQPQPQPKPKLSLFGAGAAAQLFKPPRGLLLHGPPGTGKSTLLRALAARSGCAVFELSSAVLLQPYAGEAERMVRAVFEKATRRAPACILIDDADLLCRSRTDSSGSTTELHRRVVGTLLALMDGVSSSSSSSSSGTGILNGGEHLLFSSEDQRDKQRGRVFVLAASARPSTIDAAFRRPGRFDREIELPVPNSRQRHAILSLLVDMNRAGSGPTSGNSDCASTPDDSAATAATAATAGPPYAWQSLAALTDEGIKTAALRAHGMTGADLMQVLRETRLVALKRLGPGAPAAAAIAAAADALYKKKSAMVHTQELSPGGESVAGATEAAAGAAADNAVIDDATNALAALSIGEAEAATPLTPSPVGTGATAATVGGASASDLGCTDADLFQALSKVPPSALREVVVEVPTVYWTDIGGMDSVKQSLKEVVEWPMLHAELLAAFCVQPPRGVLLYGPPGCSKTLMAKALATEAGMNFLAVRGPELLSKWLGESEKAVQTLFRRARAAAPSIVFFDEIDALAVRRGASSAGVNDRVLAQLLAELDGIGSNHDRGGTASGSSGSSSGKKNGPEGIYGEGENVAAARRVIIVAATNRPDLLDAALLRPGRIDRKVYVGPPDAASRRQILRLELNRLHGRRGGRGSRDEAPKRTDHNGNNNSTSSSSSSSTSSSSEEGEDSEMLDALVALSDGFSGAEVVSLCTEAAMLALDAGLDAVPRELLEKAAKAIQPQITEKMLKYYDDLRL